MSCSRLEFGKQSYVLSQTFTMNRSIFFVLEPQLFDYRTSFKKHRVPFQNKFFTFLSIFLSTIFRGELLKFKVQFWKYKLYYRYFEIWMLRGQNSKMERFEIQSAALNFNSSPTHFDKNTKIVLQRYSVFFQKSFVRPTMGPKQIWLWPISIIVQTNYQ